MDTQGRRVIGPASADGRRVLAASSPVVDNRMRGKMTPPDPGSSIRISPAGTASSFFKETWPRFRRNTSRPAKCGSSIKTIPQTRARRDSGLAARCAGDQGTYWAHA